MSAADRKQALLSAATFAVWVASAVFAPIEVVAGMFVVALVFVAFGVSR